MKIKKIVLPIIIASTFFVACESDDDTSDLEEIVLTQEEQNEVDDEAIDKLLNDYYLNDEGKLTAFSDTDVNDDNRTPLADIASYDSQGFWVVKKPDYVSNGRSVNNVDTEKILLQYDMFTFRGETNSAKDSIYYSNVVRYSSTINATGYPKWDPNFYYRELTEEEIENEVQRTWYEMEGFQEGIKSFNSADKEVTDTPLVDFQGLIIMPSRLAFGRDPNGVGLLSDTSVIINFELYKVEDR